MRQRTLDPNDINYSSSISACEKCRQWQPALDSLGVTLQNNDNPDAISYSAAIVACEKESSGNRW